MNTHADRPLAGRHSRLGPLGRFTAWASRRWQSRRARRLEEETVACLSAMDAKLLNDIGVDIGKLGELTTQATDVHTPTPLRHSNRRTRS
jgi:hypothetical protein